MSNVEERQLTETSITQTCAASSVFQLILQNGASEWFSYIVAAKQPLKKIINLFRNADTYAYVSTWYYPMWKKLKFVREDRILQQ